jgi:MFS family permease
VTDTAARTRITASLFLSQAFYSSAYIVMFGVMPILGMQFGGSAVQAGLPLFVSLAGRALVSYPLGWAMDRYGRRMALTIGFAGGVVSAVLGVLAVWSSSLWLLLASAALMGLARSASEQARFIAAEVHAPAMRDNMIGLIVFAGTFGAVGGRAAAEMGSWLRLSFGLNEFAVAYLLAIGLLALALLCTQILLRPDPLTLRWKAEPESLPESGALPKVAGALPAAAAPGAVPAPRRGRPLLEIFSAPDMQIAVTAIAMGQLVMTMLMVITPLHMNICGYDTLNVSTALAVHTLGMFALSPLTGWMSRQVGRVPVICAGALVLMACGLLAPYAVSLYALYFGMFALGYGWNLCHVAGSALLAQMVPEGEGGRVQGAAEVIVSITSGIGSLSSGALFAWRGFSGPGAAGLLLAGLILVAVAVATSANRRLALEIANV